MKFNLEIELGNEGMTEPLQVASALRSVAIRLEGIGGYVGDTDIIKDISGNTVGRWEVAEDA